MANGLPASIDTIIVGNGPSALLLSYILHGNIPVYDILNAHPDPLLHEKLENSPDLLHLDVDATCDHFCGSRFSYSTQALPLNALLDTLMRPNGEMDNNQETSCVKWNYSPQEAIPHLVYGSAPRTGGQWVENPVQASWDIGTLSYANMLSLPGYSFAQHYWKVHGKELAPYLRPSRRSVASYYAAYPFHVGIDHAIHCGQALTGIRRTMDGFYVASHGLTCKRLVLASGTFSQLIPPRPLLRPLLDLPLPVRAATEEALLVIGSGFSAADVIISAPPCQKIIHIFKWAPTISPSPLKACHQQAYPEYAGVYRRMKCAARLRECSAGQRPRLGRSMSSFDASRDWETTYEGFPNTVITDIRMEGNTALVTMQAEAGPSFQRRIGAFANVIGRRGSLTYLDEALRLDVCGPKSDPALLSGQTLREKAMIDLEVAPNVFIIGSLTGDSLIRFAYGSCTYVAGKLSKPALKPETTNAFDSKSDASSKANSPYVYAINGLDGHNGCSKRVLPWTSLSID